MRKLSYWGKLNPWKARIIIVLSHILFLLLAWYTGNALLDINITLPATLLLAFILYYLLAVIYYPSKGEKQKLKGAARYFRQKLCDFSLAASAYGMVVCMANSPNAPYEYFQQSYSASIETVAPPGKSPSASEILESLKYRDKSTLTRQEKRILKKEFFTQLKKYGAAKITGNKQAGDAAGLIILSIVLALGLLYLVGALACSLSCNGNDGAAIIVTLLGTAGIVIGLIFVIRSIKKKQRKEPETKTVTGA